MKIRGLFKKAAATLMAAVTALSILPATTAFAAGDIGTISFSHTYDSSGNAMRYNSSATKIRKDTELINFPLFCPKCKQESVINVTKQKITVVEPDAKTQSR